MYVELSECTELHGVHQIMANSPYPLSLKMHKLPIIHVHVNVDLPVSGFAHMFFMQNT